MKLADYKDLQDGLILPADTTPFSRATGSATYGIRLVVSIELWPEVIKELPVLDLVIL